jgi:hypothetical protein
MRLHLQREQRIRDLATFDSAIDGKLCGCGRVRLKIVELVVSSTPRHHAFVIMKKIRQRVRFGLTEQTREACLPGLAAKPTAPTACAGPRLRPSESKPAI